MNRLRLEWKQASVVRDDRATALNDCFGQLSEYLN